MANERFIRTMKIAMLKEHYYFTRINNLKNFDGAYECFENIMFLFEEHCSFLDDVPMKGRAKCIEDIMSWFILYSMRKNRGIIVHKTKANDAKKTDIKIIENFENLIINKVQSIVNLDEKDKPIFEENPILIELLRTTQMLKNDLQSNQFNIFMKEMYYQMTPITKKELRKILNKIIKEFSISDYSKNLDKFVSSI